MALTRESIYSSVDALPEPLEPTRVKKVPTGIADLDSIVDAGCHSVVPSAWTQEEEVFDLPSGNILEQLVTFLDENARDSMVVIDSITDLAVSEVVEMRDLVTAIKGLQRAAKRWNGLVYLMLTRGILERRHEQLLMDSTDGCLVFEWRTSPPSSTRQRYMYLEKFTGVLPHLPRDKIARFPTMVSSNHGLVVVYMERIS